MRAFISASSLTTSLRLIGTATVAAPVVAVVGSVVVAVAAVVVAPEVVFAAADGAAVESLAVDVEFEFAPGVSAAGSSRKAD
jgi:hypothetical protein